MAFKKTKRMLQMAEEVRQFISTLLAQGAISDPRVKGLAIHNVKMSADLQIARVNYGLSNDQVTCEEAKKTVALGLKSVTPFVRYELGKVLKTRCVPQIFFHFDDRFEQSLKITNLISEITASRVKSEALEADTSHIPS